MRAVERFYETILNLAPLFQRSVVFLVLYPLYYGAGSDLDLSIYKKWGGLPLIFVLQEVLRHLDDRGPAYYGKLFNVTLGHVLRQDVVEGLPELTSEPVFLSFEVFKAVNLLLQLEAHLGPLLVIAHCRIFLLLFKLLPPPAVLPLLSQSILKQ